jgi:glycosyltransferase involved in cell wall biosynthesis
MKKIVFLIDNLKGGGAEKAINIIVEGLYDKGLNHVVILLENQLDYKLKNGIEVHSLSQRITKYNFILLGFKLLKLLKTLSPDIIYATNTKAQILSLITKPFYKAERITNIQVDLTKQYEGREYIFNLFNKLLNNTDKFSFISYGIYENLKDKIPKKENIFIPNAVDFYEIDRLKTEGIEPEYEHIFERKVFITIGRLTEQKGQWILLEAFSKIEEGSNLVILGSGEKEAELKDLAKTLGIEKNVFFLGFQKNPFKFLYNADIFVLSSLWEGFGNVIVEAMRCELPIISTDCPSGPREILSPCSDIFHRLKRENELCEFGILTPVDDSVNLSNSMNKILEDDILQRKYKEQSILRVNDFSKEIIVAKFIKYVLES